MSFGQLMQKVVMSNPKWADAFQSKMPPSFFEKKGRAQALQTFKTAATRVPAYKDFLKKHKIDPAKVKTFADFQKLPLIDKKSYLRAYPLEDLCLDGNLSQMYFLSASSGSTGQPFFWPMLPAQTEAIPSVMELFYTRFFEIQNRSTLMLITLALGTWAAGEQAAEASRTVARSRKYPLTVATPGLDLDETLKIVKSLAKKYEQTIFIGYPPFVKDILEVGEKEGVDWSSLGVKILIGGEGSSEEWRDWVMAKIGSKNPADVVSLFATADAGIVGFETPLTIKIRRAARGDRNFAKDLFRDRDNTPVLMQYNPMARFLEEVSGELVITANLGLPLVRYNIHDRGGLVSFTSIPKRFLQDGEWHLPLFYCFGRTDAATIYGVNIYTENIQAALEEKEILGTSTGRFKFKTVYDRNQNQTLKVGVELKRGVEPTENLTQTYRETLVKTLREKNSEYNYLSGEKGGKVCPQVRLFTFENGEFAERDKIKNKYLDIK